MSIRLSLNVGLVYFTVVVWSRTLVAVCFGTSRWISVLQIWQLRHCRLGCGPVELWPPATPVLRSFRGLLSAYVMRIKPPPEDRIPIWSGQLEFLLLGGQYLSLSTTKLFSPRAFLASPKILIFQQCHFQLSQLTRLALIDQVQHRRDWGLRIG